MSACNLANTVPAILRYLCPPSDGATPYTNIPGNGAGGDQDRNWDFDNRIMAVENVRGKEHMFSLDVHGFQFAQCMPPQTLAPQLNNRIVEEMHYPAAVALVKALTGATHAFVFDHTIHPHSPRSASTTAISTSGEVRAGPTPSAAAARVRTHFPRALIAEALLARRFQVLGVWRGTPGGRSLAMCDARTVNARRDFVPIEEHVTYRIGDRRGSVVRERYGVQYAGGQRWVYSKGMTPAECVVFKCFDSRDDGSVVTVAPNVVFEDPSVRKDTPQGESVELYVLAFYG